MDHFFVCYTGVLSEKADLQPGRLFLFVQNAG